MPQPIGILASRRMSTMRWWMGRLVSFVTWEGVCLLLWARKPSPTSIVLSVSPGPLRLLGKSILRRVMGTLTTKSYTLALRISTIIASLSIGVTSFLSSTTFGMVALIIRGLRRRIGRGTMSLKRLSRMGIRWWKLSLLPKPITMGTPLCAICTWQREKIVLLPSLSIRANRVRVLLWMPDLLYA